MKRPVPVNRDVACNVTDRAKTDGGKAARDNAKMSMSPFVRIASKRAMRVILTGTANEGVVGVPFNNSAQPDTARQTRRPPVQRDQAQ